MIYEYRRYVATPGKMPALIKRFEDLTLALFDRHGMRQVGFFTPLVGSTNELHYLLEWDDLDHWGRSWAAFVNDPEWQAAAAEEEDGAMLDLAENQLWAPTAFSALGGANA